MMTKISDKEARTVNLAREITASLGYWSEIAPPVGDGDSAVAGSVDSVESVNESVDWSAVTVCVAVAVDLEYDGTHLGQKSVYTRLNHENI